MRDWQPTACILCGGDRDECAGTPWDKYVPARIEPVGARPSTLGAQT